MQSTVFTIGGMTCGHCVTVVTRALRGVAGLTVDDVRVGSATVTFDPDTISPDAIAYAIEDAGYRVLSTTPGASPAGARS